MAVVPKKKKSRKSTFKSNPYPTDDSKNLNSGNTFSFGPTFKSSSLSNTQKVLNGGNPILQFPVPAIDPMKATLLNDEVDMYFPRKHFLTKYQMLSDLVENILIKPIPTDKILPPRLFPIAFVEGMPYEKKKAELLQNIEKEEPVKPEVKDEAKEKSEDADKPADETKEDKEKAKETTETEQSKEVDVDGDENLSDYDPDFEGYQVAYPEETKEELKIIDEYLNSRKNIKERTDFLFGDLGTMKMQETSLIEEKNAAQEALDKPADFGDKFDYNVKLLDNLHGMFLKYTANSITQDDKKLDEIEANIKVKFKQKFIDSSKINQFQTKAFDSIKVEISLDDYNHKFKKQPLLSQQFTQPPAHIQTSQPPKQHIPQPQVPPANVPVIAAANTDQNQPNLPESKPSEPVDSTELNVKVTSPVKSTEDELNKKENSNPDMNHFDFDNEMLYQAGDFNNDNDNEDDDFGSLSNEVFLNM